MCSCAYAWPVRACAEQHMDPTPAGPAAPVDLLGMTPAACAGNKWPAAMLNLMLIPRLELNSDPAYKALDVRTVAPHIRGWVIGSSLTHDCTMDRTRNIGPCSDRRGRCDSRRATRPRMRPPATARPPLPHPLLVVATH